MIPLAIPSARRMLLGVAWVAFVLAALGGAFVGTGESAGPMPEFVQRSIAQVALSELVLPAAAGLQGQAALDRPISFDANCL